MFSADLLGGNNGWLCAMTSHEGLRSSFRMRSVADRRGWQRVFSVS